MTVAPFGDFVPEDVQEEVLGLIQKMGSGELVVFAGPIIDQDGEVRVPEGEQVQPWAMGDFDWFVQGVIGEPQ